jgi:hypothetical protein
MPTEPRPRTATEVWQKLVDEAGEDEVERAANMSVEEAERELAAMGFDVAAERAEGEAFLDALARGEDVGALDDAEGRRSQVRAKLATAPSPVDRKRARGKAALIAAAATVVLGGAAYAALRHHEPAPSPSPPTPNEDLVAAKDLRRRASEALDKGDWVECLMLLNQAREKDEAGDARPEVLRMRANAQKVMKEQQQQEGKKPTK